jgi:hypothetical protein
MINDSHTPMELLNYFEGNTFPALRKMIDEACDVLSDFNSILNDETVVPEPTKKVATEPSKKVVTETTKKVLMSSVVTIDEKSDENDSVESDSSDEDSCGDNDEEKVEEKVNNEKKDYKPSNEKKDYKYFVEKKNYKPSNEKKDYKYSVEKKNYKPSNEKKDYKSSDEKKDNKPSNEKKDYKSYDEKKDYKYSVDQVLKYKKALVDAQEIFFESCMPTKEEISEAKNSIQYIKNWQGVVKRVSTVENDISVGDLKFSKLHYLNNVYFQKRLINKYKTYFPSIQKVKLILPKEETNQLSIVLYA